MSPHTLQQFLVQHGQPTYRVQQAIDAVCQRGVSSYGDVNGWPKALRDAARALPVLTCEPKTVLASSQKNAYKAALKLADGNMVESVLMSPKPGLWTSCISSQVGCAMGCTFCATGRLGLMRNLTAEEITDQVLFWKQYMKQHAIDGTVNNIVYMGMGEPLANWVEVDKSLQVLTDPKVFGYGDRHISISTSGIAHGIPRLAKRWPQVNLALSLHAANDHDRSAMMPVNKMFPLQKLQKALQDYFRITNRKVFLEYILLNGKNDTPRHAKELITFVKAFDKPHLLHVNLIVYNKTKSHFEETPREQARRFAEMLKRAGIHATIRKNLGRDIAGACGQLAGEK